MSATVAVIDSSLGCIRIRVDESERLTALSFAPGERVQQPGVRGIAGDIARQLTEYFAGTRTSFDIELAPAGTEFQRRVWNALQRIPYGTTWSYADLAREIGQPAATRAVGQANGRNPIPIIIPCHRVVAHDGTIGGYSAGLERKDFLLQLEGCAPKRKRGAEAPRSQSSLFS